MDKKVKKIRNTVYEKNINREIRIIKGKRTETLKLRTIITEMEHSLVGFYNRCKWAEKKNKRTWRQGIWNYWVFGAEKKRWKSEQNLINLWNMIKRINIYIMRVPEEKWQRNYWRNNSWKLLNFTKYMNLQIQEAQQIPSSITKRNPYQATL